MNNKISDKDKKDWQDFLKKKERLTDKDNNFLQNNRIKSKTIDLHGYTLDSANKTIDEFIRKSFEENVEKITVITGKGLHSQNEKDPYVSKQLGILKYSLPDYINNQNDLLNMIKEIKHAELNEGGEGAFHIFLKKNKKF